MGVTMGVLNGVKSGVITYPVCYSLPLIELLSSSLRLEESRDAKGQRCSLVRWSDSDMIIITIFGCQIVRWSDDQN